MADALAQHGVGGARAEDGVRPRGRHTLAAHPAAGQGRERARGAPGGPYSGEGGTRLVDARGMLG